MPADTAYFLSIAAVIPTPWSARWASRTEGLLFHSPGLNVEDVTMLAQDLMPGPNASQLMISEECHQMLGCTVELPQVLGLFQFNLGLYHLWK